MVSVQPAQSRLTDKNTLVNRTSRNSVCCENNYVAALLHSPHSISIASNERIQRTMPAFWHRLFADCVVVAGILCHRLTNIRMRREERVECRMFLRVAVVVDQLGLVGELPRDLRILAREVVPDIELLRIDVTGVCSLELGRGISVDDRALARHPGEHAAIVEQNVWDKTQKLLSAHRVRGATRATKSAPSPLAGKLFDERGERLTPSHAVKGARRYRYYVSSKLIRSTADEADRGWRLPAAEIERIVALGAGQMLDDQKAMLEVIQEMGIAANRIPAILQNASSWSGCLRSEAETSAVLSALVERVELGEEGFRLTLELPIQLAANLDAADPTSLAITRLIPLQIKRRGVELRLVIEGDGDRGRARKADPVLLKAVARANQWFDDLLSGRVPSMVALAAREKVDERYISRVLRLATLSPEVVESIVEGRQPPDLTLQMLLSRPIHLPLDWAAQPRVLGIGEVAPRAVAASSTV
jgi:hypothetical protein